MSKTTRKHVYDLQGITDLPDTETFGNVSARDLA